MLEYRASIDRCATDPPECTGSVYPARYYNPGRGRFVSEDPIGFARD